MQSQCGREIKWKMAKLIRNSNNKYKRYLYDAIEIYKNTLKKTAINRRDGTEKLLTTRYTIMWWK